MKSKVLQERLKRCGRIADHKECARKKGKSASAVSGTLCTNERTNERMSPEQTQSERAHISSIRNADCAGASVADSNGIHLCQTNLAFRFGWAHTPVTHQRPTTDRPTWRSREASYLFPRSTPCPRFQFPWHTYSCHIKSVGWDQSSMGFTEFQELRCTVGINLKRQ